MEIRQARKSSVSIMPVFFCGALVPREEGGIGGRRKGRPRARKTEHRRPKGRVKFVV